MPNINAQKHQVDARHLFAQHSYTKLLGSHQASLHPISLCTNIWWQLSIFAPNIIAQKCFLGIVLVFDLESTCWPPCVLTHSQLLIRLKSESKYKTTERGGVGACSLAHNTLKGRGACWNSGMGLRRVDKLHSLTQACTQPTQGGQCIVGTPLVLGRATGNTDTQDSPRPGLGGSHHLPPYSILCTSPRGLHPNGFSLSGLPSGSPEIAPTRTPESLEPHNFASRPRIEVRDEAKLQLLSKAFQQYVAHHLQLSKSGRFPTFSSREYNWQFDSRPFLWP